jgi:hypothetical protein
MKKILLGICAVACLATAGFSEEVKLGEQEMKLDKKLDKNFCKAYNFYTYKKYVHDKSLDSFSVGSRKIILKESGDKIFTRDIGALSTDFLKENGIGYSVNMNWGNIVVKFDDYLRYANSKEDKKELSKFIMIIKMSYMENVIENDDKTDKIEMNSENNRLIKKVIIKTEIEAENNKKENEKSYSTLTSYFAETKDKQKELYGPFAKYVINGDFERAKAYIKQVNEKYEINELYEQFENACEK